MDRTKASAIVNDFFADMNPSLWNGSTSMPKSFDNRAWQYPLTDDVNLEITFVYNEEDGWCHYCDLVYQSDDPVGLIMNEEGKLLGLTPNRALKDNNGRTYGIIFGDFLVTGLTEENFGSLSDELIEKYTKFFYF